MSQTSQMMNQVAMAELRLSYKRINQELFASKLKPIPVEFVDTQVELGRYETDPRQIRLSIDLLAAGRWGQLIEVLKHEMAHQFTREVMMVSDETAHGPTFREVCELRGIDSRAAGLPQTQLVEPKILAKLHALLKLAESDNSHEAENAMRHARQAMLRHNLDQASIDASEKKQAYHALQLGRATGRCSELERVIAAVLSEFYFVEAIWVPVFRTEDNKHASILEICGSEDNLQLASYVYDFLLNASESLWRSHKKLKKIKSDAQKASFKAGVVRGFSKKLKEEQLQEEQSGLVYRGDTELDGFFRRRHPRVRMISHQVSTGRPEHQAGMAPRKALQLRAPIKDGAVTKLLGSGK